MTFDYPEEAMRCRMLGKVPTCYRCVHRPKAWVDEHKMTIWCARRRFDPLPGEGWPVCADHPGQVCEYFTFGPDVVF
jgi:hypothetical protein